MPIALTIGWAGQVLEIKSQRFLQIRYSFFFRRTATSQAKIGTPRNENAVFFGNNVV
jgi:hypothetical protein